MLDAFLMTCAVAVISAVSVFIVAGMIWLVREMWR